MPSSSNFESSFYRKLGIASLALAAVLLLASAIAVNLGLSAIGSSRVNVNRTNAISRAVTDLQASVRAAETGQRGYLLTGQARYLAPYESARQRIPAELSQLSQLVREPTQAARVRAMKPILDAKLAELAETIALRSKSFQAALRIVRTDRGQALTERFEALANEFVETQQRLLANRVAEEERDTRLTTAAAAATGLLAFLSAVLGVYLILQQRSADALALYASDLERQVEERTAKLSDANRELDAFAYTISHDLRAPLRAMHGYADALLEDYQDVLPEEGRSFARSIAAAGLRMNALIEDILTYARMARDDVALRPTSLDLVVNRAQADLQTQAEGTAEITVKEPLGAVLAHPPALQQAVENLLSNAVKFMPPGSRAVIQVYSEHLEGRVRLWVEDNGIGIEPEHRARIFEPFERLHGMETYPGTGIGLAIVRRAAERMGGACGVEPRNAGGSRFWIELQAAEETTR